MKPAQYWKNKYKKQEGFIQSAIGELTFEHLRTENLLNILNEIESFTNDNMVKLVIKNAKERDNLDKLIHSRLLFK